MHLYTDPETFLKKAPEVYCDSDGDKVAVVTLLSPALKPVHQAISAHTDLERLIVIGDPRLGEKSRSDFLNFFETLQESLDPFHIEVELTWEPPVITLSDRSRSLGFSREREIRFP